VLRIRAEQLDALAGSACDRFDDELTAHVAAAYPDEIAALRRGPERRSVRAVVRTLVERAIAYGIFVIIMFFTAITTRATRMLKE